MGKYILSLDEGTTSARAILFDRCGRQIDMVQKPIRQIYPNPGWVEQDALEIWAVQYGAMAELIAKNSLKPNDIHSIGITNQRETTILWDKESGKPVCNAIVWQCRRSADICEEMTAEGLGEKIHRKTGLIIDAYFSATKLKWIFDNIPGVLDRAKRGELCFGTVDSWLLWNLTGGKSHATDYTNASRTMLFDIVNKRWDNEIADYLGIPMNILPEVFPSGHLYGYHNLSGVDIPITGIAGDQQAALFGQTCFEAGQMKNTYGTGCFLLMNTGSEPKFSSKGLVTTMAATLDGEKEQYALEGSVFVGGAVIQWLRDELKLIHEARDSEYFASKTEDTGGVYIVPAFTGLGAPYWDMYARGTIVGLTRASNSSVLIRAAVESIAYQTSDIIRAMQDDCKIAIHALNADGGASANNLLMQFQSDISGIDIIRPDYKETTALGAAYLSGLASGFWSGKGELLSLPGKTQRIFSPSMDKDKKDALLKGWRRALKAAAAWSRGEE